MTSLIQKPCDECGSPMQVKPCILKRGHGKYCSITCHGRGTTKIRLAKKISKTPNVTCAYCSAPFFVTSTRVSRSKSGLFFCCKSHKNASQRIGGIEAIQPSHYGTSTIIPYRKKAFDTYPHRCDVCGYDKYMSVLQVHHRDRDRSNNDVANLQIVCPTCHVEIHYLSGTGLYHASTRS
jgi:hypothetical protein